MYRFFILSFVLLLSCNGGEDIKNYPQCMQVTIDNYIDNYPKPKEEPASISKYLFQNKKVYIFDPGSGFADILFTVVDENCNSICEFGGIAGIQTCSDWEDAKFLGVVWKDNR